MFVLFSFISLVGGVVLVDYLRFKINITHTKKRLLAALLAGVITCVLTFLHSLVSSGVQINEPGLVISLAILYLFLILLGESIGFFMPPPRNSAA